MKRKIELAPYLIIGHPGERIEDVSEMKKNLESLGLTRLSVQIFTPSPGTLSTAMYYSGCDPAMGFIPVERNIKNLIKRKEQLTG